MSKNKSDQNAHEEQVFNDVLRLSMASGGYKKKAALKVCGSINAGSECPDIVITRENGSIVGLEHFRIDHNIKHGRNAQSKSAELTSALKAEREKLMPRLEADDVLPEELASIVANYVSLAKYHQSCACRDDLTRSLDARLFGGKTGHARKLPKYRNHLTELSGDDGRIELGYFNEIYVMLRLVKTVRDIKLSKSKKEKGGLSNESKEVENESSWSCSSSYGCRRSTYSVGY